MLKAGVKYHSLDLGLVICHIFFHLDFCTAVQTISEAFLDLPYVDWHVDIFSVSFYQVNNHLLDRSAFHMGYFRVVNVPYYSELLAAHCFIGHTPIVWVYLKTPLLEARV